MITFTPLSRRNVTVSSLSMIRTYFDKVMTNLSFCLYNLFKVKDLSVFLTVIRDYLPLMLVIFRLDPGKYAL